jgi:Rieske Fe-S protein
LQSAAAPEAAKRPTAVTQALRLRQQPNADGTFTVGGRRHVANRQALAFTMPPDNAPGVLLALQAGQVSALSAKCTHVGCTVVWQMLATVAKDRVVRRAQLKAYWFARAIARGSRRRAPF